MNLCFEPRYLIFKKINETIGSRWNRQFSEPKDHWIYSKCHITYLESTCKHFLNDNFLGGNCLMQIWNGDKYHHLVMAECDTLFQFSSLAVIITWPVMVNVNSMRNPQRLGLITEGWLQNILIFLCCLNYVSKRFLNTNKKCHNTKMTSSRNFILQVRRAEEDNAVPKPVPTKKTTTLQDFLKTKTSVTLHPPQSHPEGTATTLVSLTCRPINTMAFFPYTPRKIAHQGRFSP